MSAAWAQIEKEALVHGNLETNGVFASCANYFAKLRVVALICSVFLFLSGC